jgi:hypothetical protein
LGLARLTRAASGSLENRHGCYCFDAVHVPLQPSDRLKEPPPLPLERRPELVMVMPLKLPKVRTPPLALTVPLTPWAMILPLVTTTAPVLLPPQPTEVTIHAPSKLPPPPLPLLLREARRGSSGSERGLLRRAGFSASIARGVERDPDSDFSSLPMLPPALPCANAAAAPIANTVMQSRVVLIARRAVFCITGCFQFLEYESEANAIPKKRGCYCFDAVHVPEQPSDRLNVPEPLRPEKRPELLQLKPETDPPDVVEPFELT